MHNKPYDFIIWGASGFTGRLVAEYLLKEYGIDNQLKWAMAGRNEGKLKSIRNLLGNENIPIVIADSHDEASLKAMAQQTKVICSTVGPYAKYGSELVATCVNEQVDYCDLTGEVQWIRKMIDLHHENAKAKGVKIVHCCGFDSIPSDMGVYFLQKTAKEIFGEYCQQIKLRVKAAKGGPSGGTIASLNNVLEEASKDPSIFKMLENPYGLNPIGQQSGKDENDLMEIEYDKDFGAWIGPFIMAAINTRVVRRSHALADFPYGKDFRYDEATLCGKGLSGKIKAKMLSSVIGVQCRTQTQIQSSKICHPGSCPSQEKDLQKTSEKLVFSIWRFWANCTTASK